MEGPEKLPGQEAHGEVSGDDNVGEASSSVPSCFATVPTDIGADLIQALEGFVKKLKSGEPIKAVRVSAKPKPDGTIEYVKTTITF